MVHKRGSVLLAILLLLLANCGILGQLGVCFTYASVPLEPHYELIEGTEVVWQKPKNQLQGVLLTFHGCSHGAIDWWPKDEDCPLCIGLPVEVNITKTALSQGYALVAVSSRDRHHSRCWVVPRHPGHHTVDTRSVTTVLPILLQREQMTDVPIYALGASSGGAFALLLPWFYPLNGVCSQIMGVPGFMYEAFLSGPPASKLPPSAAAVATDSSAVNLSAESAAGSTAAAAAAAGGGDGENGSSTGLRYPPVMFVHMPRDEHTAEMVAGNVEALEKRGSAAHVVEINPRPVTMELLQSLVPELNQQADSAAQLVAGLQKHQVLDSDKMLITDPRLSEWRLAVLESDVPGVSAWNLAPDQSALSEVLNLAWAGHEIIHDSTEEMLEWFENQRQQ